MILVTVGTHSQPFDRLIKAADSYAEKNPNVDVIIQTGVSNYQCKYAKAFQFCPKEEMSRYIAEAEILVMQGGWGAMREAIDKKQRIVAVPRIEGLEHIHDQEQVVRKLESLGCVIGVYDINTLDDAIEKAKLFDYQPLLRGNASVLQNTLNEWFKD